MPRFAQLSTSRSPSWRNLAAGCGVAVMLLISLPASARLIPMGETVLPEAPGNEFVGLAPLAGRGVVVTWVDADEEVLRARELEADLGERRSFDVADTRGGAPTRLFCPQVARIGQGRLVFAWAEFNVLEVRYRVAYRVMNEDGTPRSPIRYAQDQVPRLNEGCPRLSGGDTGFVIGWTLDLHPIFSPLRLRARTFSIRGVPTSPPIDLAISGGPTFSPEVFVDRAGGFVAAWVLEGESSGEGNELVMGRFGRDGKPIGRPLRVADPVYGFIAFTADAQSGSEVFWATREVGGIPTLHARRFDRNLRPISPVRTVFMGNDFVLIPTATVDRKGRTALLVANGGIVYGLQLDPSLDARRCGAILRVNDESPLSSFPVVVSGPGEVVVAGVEVAREPYRLTVVVRRYRLGACGSAN